MRLSLGTIIAKTCVESVLSNILHNIFWYKTFFILFGFITGNHNWVELADEVYWAIFYATFFGTKKISPKVHCLQIQLLTIQYCVANEVLVLKKKCKVQLVYEYIFDVYGFWNLKPTWGKLTCTYFGVLHTDQRDSVCSYFIIFTSRLTLYRHYARILFYTQWFSSFQLLLAPLTFFKVISLAAYVALVPIILVLLLLL